MDWISYINYAVVAVTLFFGALGWLMPGYTMDTVDLRDTGSTMGRSEVRAASGALFVIAALGALWINAPEGYAMLGFIWAGGAVGRATSLAVDGQTRLKWIFFASEVAVAAIALGANLLAVNAVSLGYSAL